MNIGLPGTGIGGLFYLLSVVIILIVEFIKTVRRKSSWRRWRAIIEQVGLALNMTIAAVITNYFISRYLVQQHVNYLFSDQPILIPLILLLTTILLVELYYLISRLRN